MDIKQYIESGALELYVLGQLSESEAREVEKVATANPKVAAEITRIENVMERLAQSLSVPVDNQVLDRTLEQIRRQHTSSAGKTNTSANGLTWIAWTIALLALATAGWLWTVKSSTAAELAEVRQQYDTLKTDCATLSAEREANAAILATLTRPETKYIILGGTDNAPDSRAVVFYNTDVKQAYFSASYLPTPPAGKQYQLWGIDGEGPKSLGVLDLDLANGALLNLDYLPGVAAFAITLEELGGKEGPDLDALQVMGKV